MERESGEVGPLPVMGVEGDGISNGADFKRRAHGEGRVIHLKSRGLVKDWMCRYHPFDK